MIASPAKAVQYYLVSEGVGVLNGTSTTPWRILLGFMPSENTHDNILCCYDYGDVFDGRRQDGEQTAHNSVQVRVRAKDYATGWAKAKQVEDKMNLLAVGGWTSVLVGTETIKVQGCASISGVTPMGREENDQRENFSVNFRLTLSEG